MTIRHTLAAVLAAAALIAPAAHSEPADMHASLAQAAAQARAHTEAKQDLRSPDARDAAAMRRRSRPSVDSASQLPPARQPTWPTHPTTLVAPTHEPATAGDGSPFPVIPLAAGALVALTAALTARYVARRGNRGTRVAA